MNFVIAAASILRMVGQGDNKLHKGIALLIPLNLQSLPYRPARFTNVFDVREAGAFDEDRRLQCVQHLRDMNGIALIPGIAACGCSGRDLTDQCCWRHLASGHAVNGVVDEEYGQFFAPVGCLNGLIEADGSQISISLIGDDDGVILCPGDARSDSRSPSVGGLNMPGIQVIVGEDGAAYGADHYAPVLNTQIRHSLAYELMQYSVSASRTVMRGCWS